jgi:aryl-alcohol dehydrogenase-like predicted oxidoreductase
MRTRKLPKSGVEIAEIGLGTWGLTGEAYGPVAPGVARATLEAALDAGATLVETAGCYGPDGEIERVIGQVLRERGRDRAFVVTRIGVDRGGLLPGVRKRFEPPALRDLAEHSLRRLGTDHVDAVVLHNPLPVTLHQGDAVAALQALRAEGKARLVGVSVGSIEAGRAALAHDIDLLEVPYNLLYPQVLHALAGAASSAHVGVLARSTLAYGLLAGTWAADRSFGEHDHRAERWSSAELARRVRQREAARFLVREHVRSLREAAIRFVLANGLVTAALVGARTPEQVRENAAAADALPYLVGDDLGRLATRLRDEGVEFF